MFPGIFIAFNHPAGSGKNPRHLSSSFLRVAVRRSLTILRARLNHRIPGIFRAGPSREPTEFSEKFVRGREGLSAPGIPVEETMALSLIENRFATNPDRFHTRLKILDRF